MRSFLSPNHYQKENKSPLLDMGKRITTSPSIPVNDYNSFMIRQRQHSKVENSNINRTSMLSPQYVSKKRSEESYLCQILAKQNQFLLNEVEEHKKKERQYKKQIKGLQKQLNQQFQPTKIASNFISISDKEDKSRGTLQHSREEFSLMNSTMKTFEEEPQKIQKLLNSSKQYIRHTGKSIQMSLQVLNAKLCRLVQQTSVEQKRQVRLHKRQQMYECVQQIQQLRQNYLKYFDSS